MVYADFFLSLPVVHDIRLFSNRDLFIGVEGLLVNVCVVAFSPRLYIGSKFGPQVLDTRDFFFPWYILIVLDLNRGLPFELGRCLCRVV